MFSRSIEDLNFYPLPVFLSTYRGLSLVFVEARRDSHHGARRGLPLAAKQVSCVRDEGLDYLRGHVHWRNHGVCFSRGDNVIQENMKSEAKYFFKQGRVNSQFKRLQEQNFS
jgi:hypothetical protein